MAERREAAPAKQTGSVFSLAAPARPATAIAFGASGNFYHSALGCFGTSCAAVCPANSNCAEIAASTTNGRTFGALANAAVCANSGGGACSIDQEHIAADRVNTTAGGRDLVYMAENCSVQPQDAGTCGVTTTTRCDFGGGDGTQCPAGETCQTGNGAVKYGDYNGNDCVLDVSIRCS